MVTEHRVYLTQKDSYSARPTKRDPNGMYCDVTSEQYKRDFPDDTATPTVWGLKHAKTGKLTRIVSTRNVARALRKPSERVAAIFIHE